MRVMIATPVYDGTVRAEYMAMVVHLMHLLTERGIRHEFFMRRGPLLHMNRNIIANRFLERRCTHLLGLDADISFDPGIVLELLETGRDFQALAYPFKELQPVPPGIDPARLLPDPVARTARYDLRPVIENGKVQVERGMLRAEAVGCGAFLVTRAVLERMIERGAVERYRTPAFFAPDYGGTHCHGFFDYLREGEDVWGEDYSFARRWVQGCGGDIWCKIDREVTHTGPVAVTGRYESRLAAGLG